MSRTYQRESASTRNLLRNSEFFLILRKSIVEGMESVLGNDNLVSSLYTLMTTFERPVEFQKRLHSMFGTGARIFERAILVELYKNVNAPFRPRRGYRFADYVNLAGKVYLGQVTLVERTI